MNNYIYFLEYGRKPTKSQLRVDEYGDLNLVYASNRRGEKGDEYYRLALKAGKYLYDYQDAKYFLVADEYKRIANAINDYNLGKPVYSNGEKIFITVRYQDYHLYEMDMDQIAKYTYKEVQPVTVKMKEVQTENGIMYSVNDSGKLITEDERDAKYFHCDICGNWYAMDNYFGTTEEGNKFCDYCEWSEAVHRCEFCEKYYSDKDAIHNVDDDYLCDRCLDEVRHTGEIGECEYCHEYHYYDNMIYLVDTGEYMCNDCQREYNYRHCDGCGEYYSEDYSDGWYDDEYDEWYCEDCAESRHKHSIIKSYHTMQSNGNIEFHGGDRETNLHMGVEIELDGNRDYKAIGEIAEYAVENFNSESNFLNPEEDSSVNVEIISEPATIEHWESIRGKFDAFFDKVYDYSFNQEDNDAGGHIHCDKRWFESQPEFTGWEEPIMVLSYIFKRYYFELITFGGRMLHSSYTSDDASRDNERHYFQRNHTLINEIARQYVGNNNHLGDYHTNRYFALNLTNENTIEFRSFGKYDSTLRLMASLKLAKHLCEIAVQKTLAEVYLMTWEDILGDDNEVRQLWDSEKNRFFNYIRTDWYNIPADAQANYLREYPNINKEAM